MNTQEVLASTSAHLESLTGYVFDVLSVSRPNGPEAAANLAKVVSKLSSFLGNLIEFSTVEFLNARPEYRSFGQWKRQDPGFPDTVFVGSVTPVPGFEIKAWFPLATEITARFRESQARFMDNRTHVCLMAWLPEQLIFGRPRIIDVCIFSGRSVAEARDNHYHNPPDYLVIEPEDTTSRTRNLQQTNTNGYKFQGTSEQSTQARKLIERWDLRKRDYQVAPEYQAHMRELLAAFPYRLDTNFAKIDRIMHADIEAFKGRVLAREIHGHSIREWSRLLYKGSDEMRRQALGDLVRDQRRED